jgi:hypothetical protein
MKKVIKSEKEIIYAIFIVNRPNTIDTKKKNNNANQKSKKSIENNIFYKRQ